MTIPSNVADATPQITAGLADKPGAVTILGDTRQCVSALPGPSRQLHPMCRAT